MMYEQSEIPLANADLAVARPGRPGRFSPRGRTPQDIAGIRTLWSPRPSPRPINDTDRGWKQWIASNLDWDDATTPAAQPVDPADRRAAGLEASKSRKKT